MTYESTQHNQIDVLGHINAMRSNEEKSDKCKTYLTSLINSSYRKSMVDWLFIVVDTFNLSRETVGIAMSILDRYVSSGKGRSPEALESKQKFQLVAITSFYMAVKIHEPVQLGINFLLKLCRGYYQASDITAMEKDILSSLEWRVCLSTTTPMEYVRQFLELLPELMDVANAVEANAMKYMDYATADLTFSTYRASSVGVACLAGALDDADASGAYGLSSLEKESLWQQLSEKLDFDIASNEIRKVEWQLLAKSTSRQPRRKSRKSLPRSSFKSSNEQPKSSPLSVFQI
mmetsp:Transcript_20348/g.42706  ORF Transcript_20348/g.42706 Transcript_20348/m.42706 type:complete len:290 (+) Transcript_20348:242-1111(+)